MDRMACVDLPAFPLQLLIREHPDWKSHPAVVVDHDKPQGVVLWSNDRARQFRILPGMRYATGLSIAGELRAGVISQAVIDSHIESITRALWSLTPGVEPSPEFPGVFWLDAEGLVPLYPSLEEWVTRVRRELETEGFYSNIAVGFTRFGTFAGAKSVRSQKVFARTEDEVSFARSVPIDRLDFAPKLRETLYKLGIRKLGAFLDLPAAGLRRRFGEEAHQLHQLAGGEGWGGLEARAPEVPLVYEVLLDQPEGDSDRLLAHVELHLRSLASLVVKRFELIASVTIDLLLDDGSKRRDELRPAEATLDLAQLLHLVRLRWETVSFPTGVIEIQIEVQSVGGTTRQETLFGTNSGASFDDRPRRDLDAADRALAQVRAQFGDKSVGRVSVEEGHLPEARYDWQPFRKLTDPQPREVAIRPLVRRVHWSPIPLPPRSRHEPDGWMLSKLSDGPVEEVIGPHIVTGGWWVREVSRAYYYVRTRNDRWFWIYHDLVRRRWFVQGEVE